MNEKLKMNGFEFGMSHSSFLDALLFIIYIIIPSNTLRNSAIVLYNDDTWPSLKSKDLDQVNSNFYDILMDVASAGINRNLVSLSKINMLRQ